MKQKKLCYKHLVGTSENKIKTSWNIIKNVTNKTNNFNEIPSSFKKDNNIFQSEEAAEVVNNYFINVDDNLQSQIDNTIYKPTKKHISDCFSTYENSSCD
jgi:hypothetical protein